MTEEENRNPEEIKTPEPEPVQEVQEEVSVQEPEQTQSESSVSREPTALEKKMQNIRLPKFRIPKMHEIPAKIARMLREFKRVIIVSKKPDIDEISKISKVSAIGILIMGFLGFVIQLVFQVIKGV